MMKLLRHFVAVDLRRFRWPIVLWIVVVVVSAILEASVPELVTVGTSGRGVGLAASLLRLADVMLALALTAFVVQSHPLVGSDAFWMTRPVPWRTLLVAKLLLLLTVLVGVPVLRDVVHMSAYSVPLPQVALAALQVTLFRTVALLLVMAAAALTPNVARFALVCAGAVLATAVMAIAGSLLVEDRARLSGVIPFGARERGGDWTWLVVANVLGAGALLLLLTVQYRTRMLRRAIAVGLAGAVIVIAIAWAWPWRWLSARPTAPEFASTSMRLVGDPSTVYFEPLRRGPDEPQWQLGWAHLRVSGVPLGWVALTRLARASLEHPGGRLISSGHSASTFVPFADQNIDEAPLSATTRGLLGIERSGFGTLRPTGPRAIMFVANTGDVARVGDVQGDYRGEFLVSLNRMDVPAVLPVQAGAAFQDGAYRLRVDWVRIDDRGIRLKMRSSNVTTIFDRTARPMYTLYLRNSRRSEASEGTMYGRRDLLPYLPFADSAPFTVSEAEVFFSDRYGWPDSGLFEMDQNWLRDAELVVVRSRYAGTVSRTLDMRGVVVKPVVASVR